MRRKMIAGVFLVAVILAGVWWWWSSVSSPSVTLGLAQIVQVAGQDMGVFDLENRSSGPIHYVGTTGMPQCHFAVRETNGVITDGGPHVPGSNYAAPVTLNPGERIEFTSRLWLGSRQRPVVHAPFRVGIKITTPARKSAHQMLKSLPLPRKWVADDEYWILWTAEEPGVERSGSAGH